jgi:hypothetical protein
MSAQSRLTFVCPTFQSVGAGLGCAPGAGALGFAGPCVQHGLYCQLFEKFMHPFGP